MADVVDRVVGVSGTVVCSLAYLFYKLYRSRTETARKVKSIPVWQADLELHNYLSSADDCCLAYAAVEGVVEDLGRKIRSHHGNEEGVMMQSKIVEHKSQRVNGFWQDAKRVLKDSMQSVPFVITKQDEDPQYRIEVMDSKLASYLEDGLDITYDRFEPHKTSLVETGMDRLFGEVTKGVQETEKMLLTGTTVLGVGKVVLQRGKTKLMPPDESTHPYILTKMTLSELVRKFESQSSLFKVLSIISAVLGGGMLLFLICRHSARWLQKRQRRAEFEELRRLLEEGNGAGHRGQGAGDGEDLTDDEACVVCLNNRRQVIALDCGHVCLCANCAEDLPLPKKCPMCRANVIRFNPAYV